MIGGTVYDPTPVAPEVTTVGEPSFHYASMTREADGKLLLALPSALRSKWSEDRCRVQEWKEILEKFDQSLLSWMNGAHVSILPATLRLFNFATPRVHTTSAEPPSTTSSSANQHQMVMSTPESAGWTSFEPTSADQLDSVYETLMSCPGRNSSTVLKLVQPKGYVAVEGSPAPYKLFMAPSLFEDFGALEIQ